MKIILRWAGFTALVYAVAIILFMAFEYFTHGGLPAGLGGDVAIISGFFGGFIALVSVIVYIISARRDFGE